MKTIRVRKDKEEAFTIALKSLLYGVIAGFGSALVHNTMYPDLCLNPNLTYFGIPFPWYMVDLSGYISYNFMNLFIDICIFFAIFLIIFNILKITESIEQKHDNKLNIHEEVDRVINNGKSE